MKDKDMKIQENLCRYCTEKCDYAGTDYSNGHFGCFVLDESKGFYLRTKADNHNYYCKLFAVPKQWCTDHFGVRYTDINARETKDGQEIYAAALAAGVVIFAVDVYSSAQYDEEHTTIGEWLSTDKNGHEIIWMEKGETEQGMVFKDFGAFREKTDRICYIPENDTFNEAYTYQDFMKMSTGNADIANQLFAMVDWQHPTTLLDECMQEEEFYQCPYCSRLRKGNDVCWYCEQEESSKTIKFTENMFTVPFKTGNETITVIGYIRDDQELSFEEWRRLFINDLNFGIKKYEKIKEYCKKHHQLHSEYSDKLANSMGVQPNYYTICSSEDALKLMTASPVDMVIVNNHFYRYKTRWSIAPLTWFQILAESINMSNNLLCQINEDEAKIIAEILTKYSDEYSYDNGVITRIQD